MHLGAYIGKIYYPDGSYIWTISSKWNSKDNINNLKKKWRYVIYASITTRSDVNYSPQYPLSNVNYRPELDMMVECDNDHTKYVQNSTGVIWWTVEPGRIDTTFKVALLSKFLALPCNGNFYENHIFSNILIRIKTITSLLILCIIMWKNMVWSSSESKWYVIYMLMPKKTYLQMNLLLKNILYNSINIIYLIQK